VHNQFAWVPGPAALLGGAFGVAFRQAGHLSAVPLSAAHASPPFSSSWPNSLFPSWCCLISSTFPPPWRPESLFWACFIVCQELAVASSSQGALLLVDHYSFSSSHSASLCVLRNVGTEQHERLVVLLSFWLSWQITFTLSWPSQDFIKLRLCPGIDVRGVRAKELLTCFDHVSLHFEVVLWNRVKVSVETLLDLKWSPMYRQCCQQRLKAYQRRYLHGASLHKQVWLAYIWKRTFLLRQDSWESGPADLLVKGTLGE